MIDQRSVRETEKPKRKFNPMHFFPSLEATFSIASNSHLWLDNIQPFLFILIRGRYFTDILVINKILNCFYKLALTIVKKINIIVPRRNLRNFNVLLQRISLYLHNVLINAIAYNSQLIFFAVRLNYSLFQLHN